MPSDLRNIVSKEIKEIIRDPRLLIGMVIMPIIMLPLMGSVIRVGFEAASEELSKMEVGMLNFDATDGNRTYSDELYQVMVSRLLVVRNSSASSVAGAVEWAVTNNIKFLIVVPSDFSEQIWNNNSSAVHTYQLLKTYGFDEQAGAGAVSSAIAAFNNKVANERIESHYPGSTAGNITSPAQVVEMSVVKGQVVDATPATIVGAIMSSGLLVPMAISLIIVLAAQLAATSVAMEKEQKTLEVLLTLPIRRTTILLGKLSGVIIVSAIATIAMIISFNYYAQSVMISGVQPIDLAAIGMAPDSIGLLLLGASLFLSIISALALSVLLAAYTKDVRSAQSLLGVLFIPIFIPAFVLMFAPVEILPSGLQVAIYVIPFSYPSLAAKALYTKEYTAIALGVIYQIVFTAIVLYIAARFFASEKIMTAGLKLRKGKKGPALD